MQRNDIPVAQSTCKKVTAVAAVVFRHRARPTDDSSWCRHQRPSVGERSRHLSDYIVRPAAVRVTRTEGARAATKQSLMDVYRATVQGKLLYAASAWSGFCTAGDRVRLNSFLRRCWKLGSNRSIAFEDMCAEADEQLFDRLIMRPSSLGGGRILRRSLSVCPSVPLSLPSVTWRHLANYNDTRAEGRISYGHLGRRNLLTIKKSCTTQSATTTHYSITALQS